MGLEGADGSFSFVAAVHVGRDKLVGADVGEDCLLVGVAGLVVESLVVDPEALCVEAGHDGVVGGDAMPICFRLEGLDEDDVGDVVVCHHDVLIATHGPDGESAGVVSVERGDVELLEVEIVGRGCDGGDEWVGVAGGEEGKVHPCDAGLELTDSSGACAGS